MVPLRRTHGYSLQSEQENQIKYFACDSSNFHKPICFAFFLDMTPDFFFSLSFRRFARFSSSAFLARLSRAEFSSKIWRPLTRALYIPAGSDERERLDFTYVGVNGFVVENVHLSL